MGEFDMWNESKSLALSKICVISFMAMLFVCALLAPRLIAALMRMSFLASSLGMTPFLATIYVGCAPAAALLTCLFLLLRRISAGQVFVRENTAYLRYISWCCYIGAIICLASAFYYIPWIAIGVAAAFMGLIVRVVKNIIAKAVSLQDEADFTI